MDKEYEKIRLNRIRKCRAELSSMRTRLGFEKSSKVLEIGAGDGEEILWWIASGYILAQIKSTREG